MVLFFWDASALAKRYAAELGSEVVNHLFDNIPTLLMSTTPWGLTETCSILLRRLNAKVLNQSTFSSAIILLTEEILKNADFGMFSISDAAIFRSTVMIRVHNLNATDAAILTVVLAVKNSSDSPAIVVVASDKRLLRAAELEGLLTLNPEEMSLSELPVFLERLESPQ